jgi:hypothetical protein
VFGLGRDRKGSKTRRTAGEESELLPLLRDRNAMLGDAVESLQKIAQKAIAARRKG